MVGEFPGYKQEEQTMRNQKLEKDLLHRERNDIRDWYLIGIIALASALVIWLPLLGSVRF